MTVAIPTFNRSRWLAAAVDSALRQTYPDLRVSIADNASTDDTEEMVRQIDDERVSYIRRPVNLGQQANVNRLLADVTTEYVVLLPDDDLLYPGHLEATVQVLDDYPTVGFVDTAFDMVDQKDRILTESHSRFPEADSFSFESRESFRRRAMVDHWPVHFSAALLRTDAARDAAPFRPEDFPPDDFGLFLRMSKRWDAAHLGACLGAFRIHADSTTAAHSTFTSTGYEQPVTHFETLHAIRLRTIDELDLPAREARKLRRIAHSSHRRMLVASHAATASDSTGGFAGVRAVRNLAAADLGILLTPRAWRLVLADLGGRRLKRALRRSS